MENEKSKSAQATNRDLSHRIQDIKQDCSDIVNISIFLMELETTRTSTTVIGVHVPLGLQELTWRSSTSGANFSAKNKFTLTENDIPDGVRAPGIHIYPDNTYEMSFSSGVLEQSNCGRTYAKRYQKMKNERIQSVKIVLTSANKKAFMSARIGKRRLLQVAAA